MQWCLPWFNLRKPAKQPEGNKFLHKHQQDSLNLLMAVDAGVLDPYSDFGPLFCYLFCSRADFHDYSSSKVCRSSENIIFGVCFLLSVTTLAPRKCKATHCGTFHIGGLITRSACFSSTLSEKWRKQNLWPLILATEQRFQSSAENIASPSKYLPFQTFLPFILCSTTKSSLLLWHFI